MCVLFVYFQIALLGTGSEPKIISSMAQKGNLQITSHVSLFDNPEAEEIYRELINQHKARKHEDPVYSILFSYHS